MGCEVAKNHKRIRFMPGHWFPINVSLVRVGLGWDFTKNNVFDLDGSITGFDECNEPI